MKHLNQVFLEKSLIEKKLVLFLAILFIFFFSKNGYSISSSLCSNCHTMHASYFENGTHEVKAAQPLLLKYNCLGCHGVGGSSRVIYLGNIAVPQVLHSDPVDLAGGNFAYITGAKQGNGTPNRRGHNVIELGIMEDAFGSEPPGFPHGLYGVNFKENFSCAGPFGCHGPNRYYGGPTGTASLKGAHHNNISGKIEETDFNATSGRFYRFLHGVWGFEVSDWENRDSTHHNEYYGTSSPTTQYYPNCNECHNVSMGVGVGAKYHTMSNFCATCHGKFHESDSTGSSSPWLRHPTDRVIPNNGEFINYTTYDVNVPVARTTVPNAPSSTVTPGQDVVMCLSCHYAHAGPYPSMLRWDYNAVLAGSPEKIGCKKCHSQK
ncbi:MAG: cytochrome c3 family protein [candidate division WOR-3 bacterium]